MKYKERTTCRACKSSNLKMVLDLNTQPLANSYHKPDEQLDEYPLKLNLCLDCWHAQLSVVVDPDEMFKHYLYVSGTTDTLRQYFRDFVDLVQDGNTVLDIACNDGSQLEAFKERGWRTFGIDPAENLHELSSKKGFDKVVCDYFNQESADALGETMDVIIAQNVFAHTDDIYDFLRCCKRVAAPHTRLYIQTSQANMFARGEFDTIYHEHLSFFCANSMKACAEANGWYLEDVKKTNIHGTSYVFVLSTQPTTNEAVVNFLKAEEVEGKTSLKFYEEFARKAQSVVDVLRYQIERVRKESGWTVVGYGAAAKANTLLNFGQIKLDFIVDDNPMKHGLLTPGMDIPIRSPQCLKEGGPYVIVPLAWNFSAEIRKRVAAIRGDKDLYIEIF